MTTPPHSKHLAALLDATADYVRTYMVRTSRTSPQDASHARRTSDTHFSPVDPGASSRGHSGGAGHRSLRCSMPLREVSITEVMSNGSENTFKAPSFVASTDNGIVIHGTRMCSSFTRRTRSMPDMSGRR